MCGTSHEGQFNDLEARLFLHSCVTLGTLYDFCTFGIWIFEELVPLFRIPMASIVWHTYFGELHLPNFGRH